MADAAGHTPGPRTADLARAAPGPLRTLLTAAVLCLVCSALVSTAAVLLGPRQRANRERVRQAHVRALIERQPGLSSLLADVDAVSVREWVVDLDTGEPAPWIEAAEFDAERAAADPLTSRAIDPERDIAGLGRRANHGKAYVVSRGEEIALLLLPVHGTGYGGALRGYAAVAPDGNTLVGLSFHSHAETPGVGGALVDDEDWLAEWLGKRVRDDVGRVRIGLASGDVDPNSPDAAFEVDAVSGATRTAGGVGNLLRFWLGDYGFGPFLRRVAEGAVPR